MRYAHELQAGDEYEPLTFVVSSTFNQQFLFALESFHPRYLGNVGQAPALVHPVILLHYSPRTRSPSFRLAPGMGSIFARDNSRFLGKPYVDTRFRTTWKIFDVYEKRGRVYQDYVAEIHDDNGRQLLWREMTSVFVMSTPR